MKFVVKLPTNGEIIIEAGHVLVNSSGVLAFSSENQMEMILAFAPGSWSSCHDSASAHCWEFME